jgi:hypothetical protein
VQWTGKTTGISQDLNVHTDFTIHTIGFELGYQLLLWKRFAVDLVMIGPGLGSYNYEATFQGTVDDDTRKQILEGTKQVLVQRFPGMNIVTSGESFNANGVMHINAYGYRYIIHVGYAF